jgi:hypothetical protein
MQQRHGWCVLGGALVLLLQVVASAALNLGRAEDVQHSSAPSQSQVWPPAKLLEGPQLAQKEHSSLLLWR